MRPRARPSAGRLAPLIEALLRREPHTRPSAAVAPAYSPRSCGRCQTRPRRIVRGGHLTGPIPAESVLHEIAEPAEWAEPERQETLLPAPAWPTPPGEPTQTSRFSHRLPPACFSRLRPRRAAAFPALPRAASAPRAPRVAAARRSRAAVVIDCYRRDRRRGLLPRCRAPVHRMTRPQSNSTATKSTPPTATRPRSPTGSQSPSAARLQITHRTRDLVKAIDTPR